MGDGKERCKEGREVGSRIERRNEFRRYRGMVEGV